MWPKERVSKEDQIHVKEVKANGCMGEKRDGLFEVLCRVQKEEFLVDPLYETLLQQILISSEDFFSHVCTVLF